MIRNINRTNFREHTEKLFKKNKILNIKQLIEYSPLIHMKDHFDNSLPYNYSLINNKIKKRNTN